MAAHIRNSKRIRFVHSGHTTHLDDEYAYNTELSSWLKSIEKRDPIQIAEAEKLQQLNKH